MFKECQSLFAGKGKKQINNEKTKSKKIQKLGNNLK